LLVLLEEPPLVELELELEPGVELEEDEEAAGAGVEDPLEDFSEEPLELLDEPPPGGVEELLAARLSVR
jgi:hypothetical protein